jgi:NAD(P)-dependent dehydrogenase (short-subunit alcohol dehydrogenase family)
MGDRLQGKIAVVTAAGSGIGKACAERFAAEGAKVLVSDINADTARATAKTIQERGGVASAHACDVSDPDQVDALVQEAISRHGRLDVMMNNAAVPLGAFLSETTNELWRQVQSVTLDGTFFGIRSALAVMTRQGAGSIISISSGAGMGGEARLGAYGSAKAAVLNLTQTAAVESARGGVRVNAISPGVIATPPMRAWAENTPGGIDGFARGLPFRRMGEPAEVANVALFLASDESSYVTGANYVVDGGVSAQVASPKGD